MPAVKEPRKARSELEERVSVALKDMEDTQIQPYIWGGELVGPLQDLELSDKVAAEDHQAPGHGHHNFLEWYTFEEFKLQPKESLRKSRRDKIFSPFKEIKVEFPGEVSIEGLGGLVESAHHFLHSPVLLDFMESERKILLPPAPPGVPRAKDLSPKEVERLEIELFDLTKYNGSSDFITAVTWAEEGISGSITLYSVVFNSRDVAVGIRPVAAMQNVPNPILVKMRTHDKLKRKLVLLPLDDDAQELKWKLNPNRGPTYVKLPRDDFEQPAPPYSHSRDRRSPSRDRRDSSRHGQGLAEADGVRATIPQFVALLHANRSILEDVESSHRALVETEDGKVVPAVRLRKPPRPNSHEGDSVHVVVLIPNEAEWADEHILWMDEDGLVEFRRRKYQGLIEREHRHRDGGSRSRSRHSGHDSRHVSPRGESRSRSRHGGHSESRSRSRHLSIF